MRFPRLQHVLVAFQHTLFPWKRTRNVAGRPRTPLTCGSGRLRDLS